MLNGDGITPLAKRYITKSPIKNAINAKVIGWVINPFFPDNILTFITSLFLNLV